MTDKAKSGRPPRSVQYDLLRVLAMIGVVMIHTVEPARAPAASTAFVVAHWTQHLVRAALPIFFMLSGALLLSAPEQSPAAFYLRRFTRLLIPLFVYSLIHLSAGRGFAVPGPKLLVADLRSVLTARVHFSLWFVYVLASFYVIVPVIKPFLASATKTTLTVVVGVLLVHQLLGVYARFLGFDPSTEFSFWFTQDWLAYFLLGYWILRLDLQRFTTFWAILAVLGYVATGLVTAKHRELNVYDLGLNMVLLSASIFALFSSARGWPMLSRPTVARVLAHLSEKTYGMYLIHGMVMGQLLMRVQFADWARHFYRNTSLLIALTLVGSYAIALAVDLAVVAPINYAIAKASSRALQT